MNGESPTPRHGHAAFSHGRSLYIHGGETGFSEISDEMWSYNLDTNAWIPVMDMSDSGTTCNPPPLAGHTATVAEVDGYYAAYIVGGRSVRAEYSAQVYRYNFDERRWDCFEQVRGGAAQVSAHAAIYHSTIHSILVFGGYRPENLVHAY